MAISQCLCSFNIMKRFLGPMELDYWSNLDQFNVASVEKRNVITLTLKGTWCFGNTVNTSAVFRNHPLSYYRCLAIHEVFFF